MIITSRLLGASLTLQQTLSYTIASEMAVGRNRNKITACALGTFFFTVWMMVFTSPYLYYTASLGPMVGFVYAGTTLVSHHSNKQ